MLHVFIQHWLGSSEATAECRSTPPILAVTSSREHRTSSEPARHGNERAASHNAAQKKGRGQTSSRHGHSDSFCVASPVLSFLPSLSPLSFQWIGIVFLGILECIKAEHISRFSVKYKKFLAGTEHLLSCHQSCSAECKKTIYFQPKYGGICCEQWSLNTFFLIENIFHLNIQMPKY